MSSARKARERGCWFLVKINILPVSLCMKGITRDSLNRCNWEWNVLPYSVRLLPSVWYRQKKSIVQQSSPVHIICTHCLAPAVQAKQGCAIKPAPNRVKTPWLWLQNSAPSCVSYFRNKTITFFLFASRHLSGNKRCFIFTTFYFNGIFE